VLKFSKYTKILRAQVIDPENSNIGQQAENQLTDVTRQNQINTEDISESQFKVLFDKVMDSNETVNVRAQAVYTLLNDKQLSTQLLSFLSKDPQLAVKFWQTSMHIYLQMGYTPFWITLSFFLEIYLHYTPEQIFSYLSSYKQVFLSKIVLYLQALYQKQFSQYEEIAKNYLKYMLTNQPGLVDALLTSNIFAGSISTLEKAGLFFNLVNSVYKDDEFILYY